MNTLPLPDSVDTQSIPFGSNTGELTPGAIPVSLDFSPGGINRYLADNFYRNAISLSEYQELMELYRIYGLTSEFAKRILKITATEA